MTAEWAKYILTSICALLLSLGVAFADVINTYPPEVPVPADQVPFVDVGDGDSLKLGTVDQLYDAVNSLVKRSKSFSFTPGLTAGYNFLIDRVAVPITVTNISAVCVGCTGANYVVGGLDHTNATGTTGIVPLDSDITIDGGLDQDDGVITNDSIAAGRWLRWHTTTINGSVPYWVTITIWYTED